MKLTLALLLLPLLTFSGVLLASPEDSTIDLLVQHEVRLARDARLRSHDRPIILVLDLDGVNGSGLIDPMLVQEAAKQRLSQGKVDAELFQGNFMRAFLEKRLSPNELLAPKLVVEVTIDRAVGPDPGYSVESTIALIEYPPARSGDNHLTGVKRWSRQRTMKGLSRDALEDSVIQFVQSEVTAWTQAMGAKYAKRSFNKTVAVSHDGETSQASSGAKLLGYSLKWNDPDNRRNHFFLGATAGTPSLVNLNLGLWGSRDFPLVAGLSGMYYGNSRRGVQLDAGVAIVNSGSFRQAVEIALVGINETTTNTTYNYDVFGRVTQTNIETLNAINFYSGPVYTLDWRSFRIQAGAGFRLQSDTTSGVRFLFQLGYTPPLNL